MNCSNIDMEEQNVNDFAKKIRTHVIGSIHRSNLIQKDEFDAKTIAGKYSESKEVQNTATLLQVLCIMKSYPHKNRWMMRNSGNFSNYIWGKYDFT